MSFERDLVEESIWEPKLLFEYFISKIQVKDRIQSIVDRMEYNKEEEIMWTYFQQEILICIYSGRDTWQWYFP